MLWRNILFSLLRSYLLSCLIWDFEKGESPTMARGLVKGRHF